jgi:hypothetical protein
LRIEDEFPLLELLVNPFIRFNADELKFNPLSKLLLDELLDELKIFPLPKIDVELLLLLLGGCNESSVNVPI